MGVKLEHNYLSVNDLFSCILNHQESEPTVIKLVDKKELLLERERLKEQEEKKRLEKIKKKAEADAKQAGNTLLMSIRYT